LGVTAANAQPYPYWDGNSGYYYNTPSFDYSGPNRGGMVETPGN
jgi:hypothetical protein